MAVDLKGRVLGSVNQEFEQIYPQPGWVEHNPEDIWQSVGQAVTKLQKQLSLKTPLSIGITNQRETCLLWERQTGQPFHNAIVWQCRRTTKQTERLRKDRNFSSWIRRRTGLVVDPYFSSTKWQWIFRNVPGLRVRARCDEVLAGTIDTYLVWRLTGGVCHLSDVSNASRTQLMNIRKVAWDPDLLAFFQIPANIMPRIGPSAGVFGVTKGCGFLPDGIPISGMIGDQQAALLGQAGVSPGDIKCTFGTGSFALMNTGTSPSCSQEGLSTIAWQLGERKKTVYAVEGSVFVCGSAVQWLRDGLKIISKASDVEKLALKAEDTGGVEVIPALTGLGAPYWNPHVRGLICGLTRGTTSAHVARATLEAMALQNVQLVRSLRKKQKVGKAKVLRIDGGAARNSLLGQLHADYLDMHVVRPKVVETTAFGAALLAGLGQKCWSLKEIQRMWQADQEWQPKMTRQQYRSREAKWQLALRRAMLFTR